MAVDMLLHGCKNLAPNRGDERWIETAEIKFLSRVTDHTMWDEISNKNYSNELQIFDIWDRITDRKKNWHEHYAKKEHVANSLTSCHV
jgi:hypothetical protein